MCVFCISRFVFTRWWENAYIVEIVLRDWYYSTLMRDFMRLEEYEEIRHTTDERTRYFAHKKCANREPELCGKYIFPSCLLAHDLRAGLHMCQFYTVWLMIHTEGGVSLHSSCSPTWSQVRKNVRNDCTNSWNVMSTFCFATDFIFLLFPSFLFVFSGSIPARIASVFLILVPCCDKKGHNTIYMVVNQLVYFRSVVFLLAREEHLDHSVITRVVGCPFTRNINCSRSSLVIIKSSFVRGAETCGWQFVFNRTCVFLVLIDPWPSNQCGCVYNTLERGNKQICDDSDFVSPYILYAALDTCVWWESTVH